MYNIHPLIENTTVTIPLVAGGKNEIAWGTLEFIPTGTQTIVGTKLVTLNGEAVFSGQSIIYTLKDETPTGESDVIQFRVKDVLGNPSPIEAVCVTFNTLPAPVSDDLEVCTSCYSSTPFFDIGSFVTGDFVPSLTEVITQPSSGTIIQNGSTFSYKQNASIFDPVDEFTFRVKNANGVASNISTAYIIRSCLGYFTNSIVDITCLPKVFNLFDLLSTSTYINVGTWSESTIGTPTYIGQGGTITGGSLGTVNFTTILPGVYKFKHSSTLTALGTYSPNNLNCPLDLEAEVTIIHTATPSISHTSNTNLYGNTYQVNFSLSNVSNPSTITVTNNTVPVSSFVINPQIVGNSGYFVLTLGTGTNNIVISAITNCDTTVTTSTTIVI